MKNVILSCIFPIILAVPVCAQSSASQGKQPPKGEPVRRAAEPADRGDALPLDEKTKKEMMKTLEKEYPELKGVDFTTKAGVRKLYEAQIRREYPELKNVDLATPEGQKRVEQLALKHHRAELDEAYPELKGVDLTSAQGRKKLDEAMKKDHEDFTQRGVMLKGRNVKTYSDSKYLNQDSTPESKKISDDRPTGRIPKDGPKNNAQKEAWEDKWDRNPVVAPEKTK